MTAALLSLLEKMKPTRYVWGCALRVHSSISPCFTHTTCSVISKTNFRLRPFHSCAPVSSTLLHIELVCGKLSIRLWTLSAEWRARGEAKISSPRIYDVAYRTAAFEVPKTRSTTKMHHVSTFRLIFYLIPNGWEEVYNLLPVPSFAPCNTTRA
jgi:hypothetical protein